MVYCRSPDFFPTTDSCIPLLQHTKKEKSETVLQHRPAIDCMPIFFTWNRTVLSFSFLPSFSLSLSCCRRRLLLSWNRNKDTSWEQSMEPSNTMDSAERDNRCINISLHHLPLHTVLKSSYQHAVEELTSNVPKRIDIDWSRSTKKISFENMKTLCVKKHLHKCFDTRFPYLFNSVLSEKCVNPKWQLCES